MVGFSPSPITEESLAEKDKEELKTQSLSDSKKPSLPIDSFDLCLPEFDDFSSFFSDSVLGFDSINGWYIEGDQKMSDSVWSPIESGAAAVVGGEISEVEERFNGNVEFMGVVEQKKGEIGVVEGGVELGSDGVCDKVVVDDILNVGGKSGDLGGLIEEKLGKVSLDGAMDVGEVSGVGDSETGKILSLHGENVVSGGVDGTDKGDVAGVNENGTKSSETESDTDSESESESSSSSSSSSSSDDEDEDEDEEAKEEDTKAIRGEKKVTNKDGKENGEIDIEEGEIMLSDAEEMVAWSDNEDAEDGGVTGPITSKNEVKVLPPVPSVSVTLQPDHQTQPVGIILSVLGAQVIVEGVEKHNPLNEGSILWITESRSPLGIIDEIFGPVKNPYYIVRYNAESEVPTGIQQGTPISFVPEYADHVLNDKSLYQKGYDASGENDEEIPDEAEFSDDEKEAEYKRMLKMKKRGTNESKPGSKRNEKRQFKNQTGNWKGNNLSASKPPLVGDNQPANNGLVPHVATSVNQDNSSCSSGFGQGFSGGQGMVPPFPMRAPAPGFCAPNGLWPNGFPHQLPQNIGLPGGLPPTSMPWMQQSQPHQLYQTPMMSQQPINTIPGLPGNFNPLSGPPNFGGVASFAPWGGACMDPNMFNQLQQFAMGLQSQQAPMPMNAGGDQASQSHGSQINHNFEASAVNSGNAPDFNQGRGGGGGGGGRRGHHRGRGRGGGRGRNQFHKG